MSKFTQKQFNIEHMEPAEFGEDGTYVVSDSYTDEEAAKIITEWENQLTGEDRHYTADDIRGFVIVTAINEDGERDWAVRYDGNKDEIVAYAKGIQL